MCPIFETLSPNAVEYLAVYDFLPASARQATLEHQSWLRCSPPTSTCPSTHSSAPKPTPWISKKTYDTSVTTTIGSLAELDLLDTKAAEATIVICQSPLAQT